MNIKRYYERGQRLHKVKTDDKKVKTAGYIPRRERIEALLDAGNRLMQYREDTYMYRDDSLALRDNGLPDDIWLDKTEAADKMAEVQQKMAAERSKAKANEKAEEQSTSEASDPATTTPNEPAPQD